MSAIPKPKRLPLIVFGAAVILLFVCFAIAEGLGDPNIPGDDVAIVQDAPSGLGHITKADFDRAFLQATSTAGFKKPPRPGTTKYEQVKQSAISNLLDRVWIQGQAADMGITTTPREVTGLLNAVISRSFPSRAAFEKFRNQSHFSQQEIEERIRLQLLSNKIQQQITKSVPDVTPSQVEAFYNSAKAQFQQPATRDVRLILNKDKAKVEQAKAALEKDTSTASWKKVAAQFSTDPSSKNNGGLRPGLTQGLLEQPLDSDVFNAPKGKLEGPVRTPLGYYLFEVEKANPAHALPLDRTIVAQIRSQLLQQAQQNAVSQFVTNYYSKWTARTFCAGGYVISRCNNFRGNAHPQNAPPGCYQANPKGGRPASCPAPVLQVMPALPGSVSIISPQGTRLAQRPNPGTVPSAATGLGGGLQVSPGGATTGAPAPR